MLRDGCGGCTLKAMSRVKKGMFSVRLVLVGALAASLSAQIQFPGSGGPFPGGGGPIGGGGGPIGGGGRRGKNTDSGPGKGKKDAVPVTTTTGMLRAVAGNQFVMEGDDHRIINL